MGTIIFSMSIGHMIGMLAVALYLLAIVVDMVRSGSSVAPVAIEAGDDTDSDAGTEDRAAHPGDDSPPSSRS